MDELNAAGFDLKHETYVPEETTQDTADDFLPDPPQGAPDTPKQLCKNDCFPSLEFCTICILCFNSPTLWCTRSGALEGWVAPGPVQPNGPRPQPVHRQRAPRPLRQRGAGPQPVQQRPACLPPAPGGEGGSHPGRVMCC